MATRDYKSSRQDYKTPPYIYQSILEFTQQGEFDIDVCCSEKNIPARKHFKPTTEPDKDSLVVDWQGMCFMNPPFKDCKKWIKKATEEVDKNNCTVWAILPSDRLETSYFHKYILGNKNCTFGFMKGKVGFIIPGEENILPKPSQKIMIVCFAKNAQEIQMQWNYYKILKISMMIGV